VLTHDRKDLSICIIDKLYVVLPVNLFSAASWEKYVVKFFASFKKILMEQSDRFLASFIMQISKQEWIFA
jgi:hypothetical protein